MHEEQVGSDGQAPSAAGRTGPDAGRESLKSGEARHQDQAASDGTVLCQREVLWFRPRPVERALTSGDSGILDRCCSEPPGLAEVWMSTEDKCIGDTGPG